MDYCILSVIEAQGCNDEPLEKCDRYFSLAVARRLGLTDRVAPLALLGLGPGAGFPLAFRCISATVKLIARMSSLELFFVNFKGRI